MTLPARTPRLPGRWDPFREFEKLHDRMGRLLESAFGDVGRLAEGTWVPPAGAEETDDAYIVEADLPVVRREDVNIELRDREFAIHGEIRDPERAGACAARPRWQEVTIGDAVKTCGEQLVRLGSRSTPAGGAEEGSVMELFPPMPYKDWTETKRTLHRFAQVVGKIRLAASARRNHWWNVPFHLTGRGITTRPMGLVDGNPIFTIDFDFVDHRLLAHSVTGQTVSFSLVGQSVASFYRHTFEALHTLGVAVSIRVEPFDLPDGTPLDRDTEHAAYDPVWVARYWQVLSQVNLVMEEFAGRYSGKTSPVHHFWHTFDIALTRFSDRQVDQPPEVDPVTREAYSRECISVGFWFGDDNFPHPAFYSYTAPEPDGLADEALQPPTAQWVPQNASHLAVLRYDDARAADDRRGTVLDFFESAYQAGARRTGWDITRYACRGGVTDPHLEVER